MVVVQIFTLVLTTALLRHSERTISAAPSPRFGGPRLAAGRSPCPWSHQLIPPDSSRGAAFPSAPPRHSFGAGKQMSGFCSVENGTRTLCDFGSPFKQAVHSASAPSPVNRIELKKNLSLEPHNTQLCGSAPMTSRRDTARWCHLHLSRILEI